MKCLRCKKKIDDEDIYCGYCGVHQSWYKNYLQKVENKVHHDQDKAYNQRIKIIEKRIKQLENERMYEINKISNARWTNIVKNKFAYNMTEGKVKINQIIELFSSIKGAELNIEKTHKIVTTETGQSKKQASLGGAVAGGLLLGPVGAVAGGVGLGKTKSKGNSISEEIPTCTHIGVSVNINGFNSEIVLLSTTIEQSSSQYQKTYNEAQEIVNKLRELSSTEVPTSYLKPEEENIVKEYDKKIKDAHKDLAEAKKEVPNYKIPQEYL